MELLLIGESVIGLANIDDEYFIDVMEQRSRHLMRLMTEARQGQGGRTNSALRAPSKIGCTFLMSGDLLGMAGRLHDAGWHELAAMLMESGEPVPGGAADAMGEPALYLAPVDVARLRAGVKKLLESSMIVALDEFEQDWLALAGFLAECEQKQLCLVRFWS